MKLLPHGAPPRDAHPLQEIDWRHRIGRYSAIDGIPPLRNRTITMPSAPNPFAPPRDAWHQAPAPVRRGLIGRLRNKPIKQIFGESQGVTILVAILLCLIALLIVRPMVRSILSYHRTAALLQERRAEVAALSSRHTELEQRKAYYQTPEFIAERAREYGLVRPGESAFVIRELVHPEMMGRYARAQLANGAYEASAGTPATRTPTSASGAGAAGTGTSTTPAG